MDEKKQYISLASDIIAQQVIILGPDIAVLRAQGVNGLVIDGQGRVIDIQTVPASALNELVNSYVELSGKIVNQAMVSIFKKYPELKMPDIL